MARPTPLMLLSHPHYGECRLERVEGMNWLIRSDATDALHRVPVSRRAEFSLRQATAEKPSAEFTHPIQENSRPAVSASPDSQTQRERVIEVMQHGLPQKEAVPIQEPDTSSITAQEVIRRTTSSSSVQDRIRLRRMFEAMRNGLPPSEADLRRLAIGVESLEKEISAFLAAIHPGDGAVRIIRGVYGQGKSFSLKLLRSHALEQGFLVASTEIDASENQLNKPHHVYRDLLRNLRIPGNAPQGIDGLAALVHSSIELRRYEDLTPAQTRRWLAQQIECEPLAWLLSDARLMDRPDLLGLLRGDPNVPVQAARKAHILRGRPSDWPQFTAGTQGDFACYLLSGFSKLARVLGFKGLILIIDEMEKWQDLNWRAQTQAGNLIGGLIWAATGPRNWRFRGSYHNPNPEQPERLEHSLRSGGYPFTTPTPCNLGLVIAMTPRGNEGPEDLWRHFGPLGIFELPSFTTKNLRLYLSQISADYCNAYSLPEPDLAALSGKAVNAWLNRSDESARSAVQAVIGALDEWRNSLEENEF